MSDTFEPYDLKESFPMLVATCAKYMRETLKMCFIDAGYKVTHEQWAVLTWLAERDGVTQQELADSFERSKVAAYNLLKKLEQNSLILRKTDSDDSRYNRVYLTDKGMTLQRELTPLAKSNTALMSEGIPTEDIETFKSVLRKLNTNMKSRS